jgi:hypothetical protein
MFKRRFRLPSPALVISMITLSLVLGGTAFAASTATHKDKKADTKLIKKLAPTLSVKHAKTATNAVNATNAANATHATSADSATNATNATNATHATNATNATHATNSDQLGGVLANSYEQFDSDLPSGKTETGVWGTAAGNSTSGLAAFDVRFYPTLAAPLDGGHVIFTSAASATHCPGVGQADPGFFCVYAQQLISQTFNSIGDGDTTGAARSGAEVFFNITGASSFAAGQWAVTAP